jgi:hypothetical protein
MGRQRVFRTALQLGSRHDADQTDHSYSAAHTSLDTNAESLVDALPNQRVTVL